MGKKYKKGNKSRHSKKYKSDEYILREREINKLINIFKQYVLNKPYTIKNYKSADRLRIKIKELLYRQGNYIFEKSNRRRWIYYDQTSHFKGLYVTWKKRTFHLFLKVHYDIPVHLIPSLCVFYRDIKTLSNPSFQLFF